MNRLQIPGTNKYLTDGDLVILARFPNVKWVIHYGKYMYNGMQYQGWYFQSVPSKTNIPVNPQDLQLLTVVSASGCCPTPNPGGCPCPPMPPGPAPEPVPFEVPFTEELREQLSSAFISVPSMKDLEDLKATDIPDGRIVRVNDGGRGHPVYYEYNIEKMDFIVLPFVFDEDLKAVSTEVNNLSEKVEQIVQTLHWKPIVPAKD